MKLDRRSFIAGTSVSVVATLGAGAVGEALPGAGQIARQQPHSSDTPAVITQALAEHTVNVKYDDLDAATIQKAKHRILDLMGCAIGGAPALGNRELVQLMCSGNGSPESSVIGYPYKARAWDVALLNAVISRSYDFEVMTVVVGDTQIPSHHSPTTCMTSLALCEKLHLSGKDFLTALVVGDDIAARMITASGFDFGQGWDGVPIFSSIAATAIASRLLGLSAQQTQDAFGITTQMIAGNTQNIWDASTDWKLPGGLVAKNGIFAAELAKKGWTGVGDALLAPLGFYAQYTHGCTHPENLTNGLGKAFYAEEYFKPYPACAGTHPSIECALALRKKNQLAPSDIARVVIRQPAGTMGSFVAKPFQVRRFPQCDANFSLQFTVADALLHGAILQQHYDESAIRSAEMTALIQKVSLAALPPERRGLEIEVTTKDGRTLVESGAPRLSHDPTVGPSTYEELVTKFRQQVAFSRFVPNDTAEKIIHRIDNIEHEANMADFVRLLTTNHLPDVT